MTEINEDDPIYKAIDSGGGQTCNINGVVSALDAAGYAIVPKDPTPATIERMAKGIQLANNNSTGMKFTDLTRAMACMAYMEAVRVVGEQPQPK